MRIWHVRKKLTWATFTFEVRKKYENLGRLNESLGQLNESLGQLRYSYYRHKEGRGCPKMLKSSQGCKEQAASD